MVRATAGSLQIESLCRKTEVAAAELCASLIYLYSPPRQSCASLPVMPAEVGRVHPLVPATRCKDGAEKPIPSLDILQNGGKRLERALSGGAAICRRRNAIPSAHSRFVHQIGRSWPPRSPPTESARPCALQRNSTFPVAIRSAMLSFSCERPLGRGAPGNPTGGAGSCTHSQTGVISRKVRPAWCCSANPYPIREIEGRAGQTGGGPWSGGVRLRMTLGAFSPLLLRGMREARVACANR
jgi:hypothetical protein